MPSAQINTSAFSAGNPPQLPRSGIPANCTAQREDPFQCPDGVIREERRFRIPGQALNVNAGARPAVDIILRTDYIEVSPEYWKVRWRRFHCTR